MISKRSILFLCIALLALSGCGGMAKFAPTNSTNNQRLVTAQIMFLASGVITARYTDYKTASDRDQILPRVQRNVQRFNADMEKYLPGLMAAAFRQRNVPAGIGATVALKPIDYFSEPGERIFVTMEVTVRVNGQVGPPWTMTVQQRSTAEDPFGEAAAARVMNFIVAELVKAGFLPPA